MKFYEFLALKTTFCVVEELLLECRRVRLVLAHHHKGQVRVLRARTGRRDCTRVTMSGFRPAICDAFEA
jgi:hypothetical protein